MSSSVFFESNVNKKNGEEGGKADADLVVIYGKKGISFDQKGLDNLIEEKTISSISVVRLASPTPSMKDEESEAEKLEEELRKVEIGSSADSGNNSDNEDLSDNDENSKTDSEEETELNSSSTGSDSSHEVEKYRNRKARRKVIFKQRDRKIRPKFKKEKPELVALKLEEFYTGQAAKDVLRTAFKIAGVAPVKKTAEHDFLLCVIKNDHNYTPFTSPEQMKAKIQAEKDLQKMRRMSTHSPAKINLIKKKPQYKVISPMSVKPENQRSEVPPTKNKLEENKGDVILNAPKKDNAETKASNLIGIGDSNTSTEKVRDSDFDYDLSIRNSKQPIIAKNDVKPIVSNKVIVRTKPEVIKIIPKLAFNGDTFSIQPQTVKVVHIDNVTKTPSIIKTVSSINSSKIVPLVKRPTCIDVKSMTKSPLQLKSPLTAKIISVQNLGSPSVTTPRSAIAPFSSQTVKQIDLNKVMLSPKGVFTNIDTFLEDENKKESNEIKTPSTPKSSGLVQIQKTPSKGFTPLVLEAAVNNQLPSQISVQTHQSSSEIAAENEQLDLIDSLVQDELKKSASESAQLPVQNVDIPGLVKMLESTEQALESSEKTNTNIVTENFDSTPTDVLPEDLLQHVVDLIEKHESLKEAVEKEVLGSGGKESNTRSSSPPPLAPITLQSHVPIISPLVPKNNKSIIQIMTSNDTPPKQQMQSYQEFIEKVTPNKAEPIQIIRGNGRVITLPPIEAPTTRAKRRAQAQPISYQKRNISMAKESDHDESFEHNISSVSDSDKKPEKKSSNRSRVSLKGGSAAKNKRKSSGGRKLNKARTNKSRTETDLSESQDDDDPNKLWCICRQPHNNRFMICCDVCEDWFHGTCVNVTKAMGVEMELKQLDWKCPKCLQKQEEKKQLKITDMLSSKHDANQMQSNNSNKDTAVVTTEQESFLKEDNPRNEFNETNKTDMDHVKKNSQESKMLGNPKNPNISKTQSQKDNAKIENLNYKPVMKMQTPKSSTHQTHIKVQKTVATYPTGTSVALENSTKCVVCKKPAKDKSVYCSDDCLNKYIRNVLHQVQSSKIECNNSTNIGFDPEKKKKSKGLFEDLLSMADKKPKVERLNVIERKTGKILTGHSAPSMAHIKKWLQENPSYEVIIPGTIEALEIEKKSKQKLHQSLILSNATSSNTPSSVINIVNVPAASTSTAIQSPVLQKVDTSISKPAPNPQTITLTKQIKPQQVNTKSEKAQRSDAKDIKTKEKALKKQTDQNEIAKKSSAVSTEPIRSTVRRMLKEELLKRITYYKENVEKSGNTLDEEKSLDVEKEEVEQFASELDNFVRSVEIELYNFFNKDTGAKYKAKSRSLIFNVKDPKNMTLFKKICSKLIDAKQLVKMTTDQLASRELAQWRQSETKHQLEMIKKSELEILSCNRNYLLKTHKGEEVIVEKTSANAKVDIPLPLDQVVSMFEHDTENTSAETSIKTRKKSISSDPEYPNSPHVNLSAKTVSSDFDDDSHHSKTSKKDHDKEHEHSKSSHDKSKHKAKDHKTKSKFRNRSCTKSRSRSRSRSGEKRRRGSSSKETQHKQKDHVNSFQEKDKPKAAPAVKDVERKEKKASTAIAHSTTNKDSNTESAKEKSLFVKKNLSKVSLDTFNLVDKILESTKTVEEAANLVYEKEHKSIKDKQHPVSEKHITDKFFSDSDQEPSSTVSIATPPQDPYTRYYGIDSPLMGKDYLGALWSRTIHMIDVTTFQTTIQPLSSNSVHLNQLIPKELEVVGRIVPDTVWDYVAKIKRSPNKEIALVRLIPSSENDTSSYIELYQYLENRNRLGVIKSDLPQIRDFYVYPLGMQKEMPLILHPLEDTEFFTDSYRPDILIGILVRVHGKRKATQKNFATTILQKIHNTPPGSPKRKKQKESTYLKDDFDIDAIIKAPITTKPYKHPSAASSMTASVNDADEPYSPGGSSSDGNNSILPTNFKTHTIKSEDDDLKRKMEELNRQIAVQEMEIAGLLNVEHSSNVLANISIPPDLSQILASIQPKPSTSSNSQKMGSGIVGNPEDEEYDPETNYEPSITLGKRSQQSSSSTSRLAQLTEAELLSMVPDELLVNSTQPQGSEEPPPPGV